MSKVAKRAWHLLKGTVEVYSSSHAGRHAAAVSYSTLFSLAPLLILLVAGAGWIFGEQAVTGEISSRIAGMVGEDAATLIENVVRGARIEITGLLPTVLAVIGILLGATAVFSQLHGSLNRIWLVEPRSRDSIGIINFLLKRLASLGMVLAIGFLLLVSLLASIAVAALVAFAKPWLPVPEALLVIVDVVIRLALATLLFGMIFKILPDVDLSWPDVARGAAITAVLFTLGQNAIALYLTTRAPNSAYGAAGSLVLILMWVYYSAMILFFGAAFTRVQLEQRGGTIVPDHGAIRLRITKLEEGEQGDEREASCRDSSRNLP
jgi:membrane protein